MTFTKASFAILLPTTAHTEKVNLRDMSVTDLSAKTYDFKDLRVQLAQLFPYDQKAPIPRKVWQTWKTSSSSVSFPSSFRELAGIWKSTCEQPMPAYQYQLITDDQMVPLLKQMYGSVPQVIEAFESMPLPILKADFFRYLILYARGGIYSDMDTFPLKPLDSWPSKSKEFLSGLKNPIKYKNSSPSLDYQDPLEPGLIIGIEADPDRTDWSEWYARRIQFCQWTIQSKPGHPLLRELITNITSTTLESVASLKSSIPVQRPKISGQFIDDYNVNMRDKRRLDTKYDHKSKKTPSNTDGTDIMNWTGPGIFSDIVFHYLNNIIQTNDNIMIFNDNLKANKASEPSDSEETTMKFYNEISSNLQKAEPSFHWGFFSLMEDPSLIDDILVLPITSFSPDVGQMRSKPMSDDMALVKHTFEGSWKDDEK